jgi:hypothetical protein
MTWDLSLPVGGGLPITSTSQMSFACIRINGRSTSSKRRHSARVFGRPAADAPRPHAIQWHKY